MVENADGVTEALTHTALAGFSAQNGPGETLVVPDIEPDDLLEAWRAARSVVPATRR